MPHSALKITLLGTGTSQGIPVMGCSCAVCVSTDPKDNRLRTSVLVESAESTFVIDCGPDFRQQMLREKVQKVDAVLLTHDHQDHVAGMDELRSYIFKNKCPMPVYAETQVLERLKKMYHYAFIENPYPGAPEYALHNILPGEIFIGDLKITALRLQHGKLPILGFRIKNFAYLTDVNFIPAESLELLQNLDVLVIDALHHKTHHSHFNLQEALLAIEEIAPKNAYLTHMSHTIGLHEEVEKDMPENVFLGYDGLQFKF